MELGTFFLIRRKNKANLVRIIGGTHKPQKKEKKSLKAVKGFVAFMSTFPIKNDPLFLLPDSCHSHQFWRLILSGTLFMKGHIFTVGTRVKMALTTLAE